MLSGLLSGLLSRREGGGGVCERRLGAQSRPGVTIFDFSRCLGGVFSRVCDVWRSVVLLSLSAGRFLVGEIWRGAALLSLLASRCLDGEIRRGADACGVWRADVCCGGLLVAAEWATASLRSPFTRFFGTDRVAGSGRPCLQIWSGSSTCPTFSSCVGRSAAALAWCTACVPP